MRNPRRWGAIAAGALAAGAFAGCMDFTAHIQVAPDERVTVAERIVVDPNWHEEVGDSLGATDQLIRRYADEAKARGGDVETFGVDSAKCRFEYESLPEFVYWWPDTTDNRSFWDRSVYEQVAAGDTVLHELTLFRMSPPDPEKRLPNQRFPILTFAITVPIPAFAHNAHHVAGSTYYWRFTEQLQQPDSVWIQWVAEPGS